jgi:hypothetical protein
MLDVVYDHRSKVILKSAALCNLEPFTKSFEDCLDAAKRLWASQKGNYPKDWKKRILQASLMIDSSFVTEMLRPFGEGVIYGPSLESYVTIAIRDLIDKVVLTPVEGVLRIDLHGEAAAILQLSAAGKKGRLQLGPNSEQLVVVAGVGFEPTTFRL